VCEITLNVSQKIFNKLWHLVLEKDLEDKLDGSGEKQRSLTQSQRGKEHPAYNKKKEG
jgi:hypothetical protein